MQHVHSISFSSKNTKLISLLEFYSIWHINMQWQFVSLHRFHVTIIDIFSFLVVNVQNFFLCLFLLIFLNAKLLLLLGHHFICPNNMHCQFVSHLLFKFHVYIFKISFVSCCHANQNHFLSAVGLCILEKLWPWHLPWYCTGLQGVHKTR